MGWLAALCDEAAHLASLGSSTGPGHGSDHHTVCLPRTSLLSVLPLLLTFSEAFFPARPRNAQLL